jgi:hypothetical protein
MEDNGYLKSATGKTMFYEGLVYIIWFEVLMRYKEKMLLNNVDLKWLPLIKEYYNSIKSIFL